jgi:DNA-directed RNA polymerase subunit alpha
LTDEIMSRVETLYESEDFGRFQVEPLERGFGVTVGNALRRVLLSSLPGAAVTSVKVDGVYHEFDTIPGVKEDTTELILNLKQLRVKSHTDQPVSLRLMSSGPGVVTASDLIYPAEVEIANPELHIATLDNADSRLELELTVEPGKGYLPSDGREPPSLGVIPVDAIFTPVRRVNYSVESTRVGARTDLDRLVLEVNTDGTIKPTEALAEAANLLIQQFTIIADLTRVGRPGEKPTLGAGAVPPHIAEMPIEQLELSQRTYNCLKRSQITRVGQILERTPDELLQLRNFGQKSLQELQDKLKQHGLTLPGAESAGELGDLGEDDHAEDSLEDESDVEDVISEEMLAGDFVSESEEDEDLDFGAALDSDEFDEDDEEALGPRAGRTRGARGHREMDEWGNER